MSLQPATIRLLPLFLLGSEIGIFHLLLVLSLLFSLNLCCIIPLVCPRLENETPQAAFKVLENMGSVTNFSVANSVKRGVVVVFGAVVMGTPVGLLPTVGAAVAVLGTAAYWVSTVYSVGRTHLVVLVESLFGVCKCWHA